MVKIPLIDDELLSALESQGKTFGLEAGNVFYPKDLKVLARVLVTKSRHPFFLLCAQREGEDWKIFCTDSLATGAVGFFWLSAMERVFEKGYPIVRDMDWDGSKTWRSLIEEAAAKDAHILVPLPVLEKLQAQDPYHPSGPGRELELDEYKVVAKYFTPWTGWTWYAVSASRDEETGNVQFFGFVDGLEAELGYFWLSELKEVKGPGGLLVERDLYWDDTKSLKAVMEEVRKNRGGY